MNNIPDDISTILREIDQNLKEQGLKPHQRSMHAVVAFAQQFNLSMPIVPLSKKSPTLSDDIEKNDQYTKIIYDWYDKMYGDGQNVDPSEKSRVVVLADGDIWELPIPLLYGEARIIASNDFLINSSKISSAPIMINACQELKNITPMRLKTFSDGDVKEVFEMFNLGFEVKAAFDKFREADSGFVEAENDWSAAVMHLTTREPAHGQSRWSSLQMAEKFMKGLLRAIGDVPVKDIRNCGHNLGRLHGLLEQTIPDLSLRNLIEKITCSDQVRYGEVASTREQSYAAHKAALALVAALKTIYNLNQ